MSWSTRRPARTSPDSRVSPITPAPMIAVLTPPIYCGCVISTCTSRPRSSAEMLARPGPRRACSTVADAAASLLGDQGADEEREVLRLLGQPAHEVAVPLGAVG